jgi:hypothetical protein
LIAELGARLGVTPDARLKLLDGIAADTDMTDLEFQQTFGKLRVIAGSRS